MCMAKEDFSNPMWILPWSLGPWWALLFCVSLHLTRYRERRERERWERRKKGNRERRGREGKGRDGGREDFQTHVDMVGSVILSPYTSQGTEREGRERRRKERERREGKGRDGGMR
jgi:hypothetical protein